MSVICTIIIYRLKSFANRLEISLIRAKNSASAGIYNMYIMCTYNIVEAVYSAYRRIFLRDCFAAPLRLCMFVLWDGAELCDAFQFFCAVILCGDLHGFSNLCRELYAAAYVLRAAILYNIFVYSALYLSRPNRTHWTTP